MVAARAITTMGRRLVFLAITAGATIATRETVAITTAAGMMPAMAAAGLLTAVGVGVGVARPMAAAAVVVDPMVAGAVEAVVVEDMAVDSSSILKLIL